MKKLLFLTAALCLFSAAALGQAKIANYSGTWTMDVSRSKMDARSKPIDSLMMTVVQTDAELSITTETKRAAAPADAPQSGRMGRSDGKTVYRLDGSETILELEGLEGRSPQTLQAKLNGGRLELYRTLTFASKMSEVKTVTKEAWELSADGRTLTVNREMKNLRGTNSSTLVFAKK